MSRWMIPADQLDNEKKSFLLERLHEGINYWIKGLQEERYVLLIHSLDEIKRKKPDARILIIHSTQASKQFYLTSLSKLKTNVSGISFLTHFEFKKTNRKYDHIFCDDIQDTSASSIVKMRRDSGKLLIAGDPYPSMYTHCPYTNEPVVHFNEISSLSACAEYSLCTHNLTQQMTSVLNRLLPNIGIIRLKQNSLKMDTCIRRGEFISQEKEVEYTIERALSESSVGYSSAILLSSHDELINFVNIFCKIHGKNEWKIDYNNYGISFYHSLNRHLEKTGVYCIDRSISDIYNPLKKNKVILMTYENAKHMSFDNIYLPFLHSDAKINNAPHMATALISAKQSITVTYSGGYMHHYLEAIESECTKISHRHTKHEDVFDFDF